MSDLDSGRRRFLGQTGLAGLGALGGARLASGCATSATKPATTAAATSSGAAPPCSPTWPRPRRGSSTSRAAPASCSRPTPRPRRPTRRWSPRARRCWTRPRSSPSSSPRLQRPAVAVHVAFGLGFYTFVLHGFMRELPGEIQEAATIDGAGVAQVFWRIVLPLTRPALAALGALSFTWIFNDLLWAITVLRTDTRMPVTPALLGLQGQFVSSWDVIAAGTIIAAVPTPPVFLRFRRHFISGLAIGAVK